jgi:hypothetical protein
VNAESRYKVENFIDTAVNRANDAGLAWLVTMVGAAGLNAAWLVALPAAGLWLVTGFRLANFTINEPAQHLTFIQNDTYHWR